MAEIMRGVLVALGLATALAGFFIGLSTWPDEKASRVGSAILDRRTSDVYEMRRSIFVAERSAAIAWMSAGAGGLVGMFTMAAMLDILISIRDRMPKPKEEESANDPQPGRGQIPRMYRDSTRL